MIPKNQLCSVSDCTKPAHTRGMCSMHDARMQRHGTTDLIRPTIEQRFWSRVNKDGPHPDHVQLDEPCWVWTGTTVLGGYGRYRNLLTHRYSWSLRNGRTPPPDRVVMHLCDNPPCVNPAHLRLATQAENVKDMMRKGRYRKLKLPTECPYGHPYTPENTYVSKRGSRNCRACRRKGTRPSSPTQSRRDCATCGGGS